jgi:hypothetical protein
MDIAAAVRASLDSEHCHYSFAAVIRLWCSKLRKHNAKETLLPSSFGERRSLEVASSEAGLVNEVPPFQAATLAVIDTVE